MSKHTPGPWFFVAGNQIRSALHQIARVWMMRNGEGLANARLIASAPAMELALEMISLGVARVERSPSGKLIEFCFDGIRYSHNGDWAAMIDVVGWDKARAAIAKAEEQQ